MDRNVAQRRIAFVVALILAVTAGVVLWPQERPPATLRLGAYEGDVGALEWVALDRGLFAKAGIDVQATGFPSGNAAMEALRAGTIDVATAADLVVAKRGFNETDLRIVADICRYWNKGVVARRDRGIAVPADLKGKRIGVPATSSAEYNLAIFLAVHGLTSADVTVIDTAPDKLADSIAAGTIDAAIVWQPHVLAIQRRLGDNAVTLMDGGTEAHLLLVTRADVVAARAADLERLLRGLLEAEEWAAADPQAMKDYLVRRFALEPSYVEVLWPRLHFAVGLPQEILEAMDGEARWLAKGGQKAPIPSYADTVHPDLLARIKPAAVGVFSGRGR
jgi:NitT/TauT family transport system substrate-binding protein